VTLKVLEEQCRNVPSIIAAEALSRPKRITRRSSKLPGDYARRFDPAALGAAIWPRGV
jgi:hypothetical protein